MNKVEVFVQMLRDTVASFHCGVFHAVSALLVSRFLSKLFVQFWIVVYFGKAQFQQKVFIPFSSFSPAFCYILYNEREKNRWLEFSFFSFFFFSSCELLKIDIWILDIDLWCINRFLIEFIKYN